MLALSLCFDLFFGYVYTSTPFTGFLHPHYLTR